MSWICYWRHRSIEEQQALADKVGVTRHHLTRIAGGSVSASDPLVKRLVEADSEIQQVWFL